MLELTRRARHDLAEIYNSLTEHSVGGAERWLRDVHAKFDLLRAFPEIGRSRPDLAPEARSLPFDRWLIVYRITSGDVLITRFVDGRRDLFRIGWSQP